MYRQGKTFLLSLVREVPSRLMGCACISCPRLVRSREEGNSNMWELFAQPCIFYYYLTRLESSRVGHCWGPIPLLTSNIQFNHMGTKGGPCLIRQNKYWTRSWSCARYWIGCVVEISWFFHTLNMKCIEFCIFYVIALILAISFASKSTSAGQ